MLTRSFVASALLALTVVIPAAAQGPNVGAGTGTLGLGKTRLSGLTFDGRAVPAAQGPGSESGIRAVAAEDTVGGVIAAYWISAFSAVDLKVRYAHPIQKKADRDRLSLNLVGELNLAFFDGGKVVTIGAGPQVVKILNDKVAAYAHVMGGILRDSGFTDFMLQPGAGVIVALEGKKYFLTAGVDFPIDFFDGGSQRGTQLGGGVVFPLGR